MTQRTPILSSTRGDKVTIKDLAAELGMSHSTISRALADHPQISDSTKAAVRAAAERSGYVPSGPARMMRRSTSTLIGLVVPSIQFEFWGTVARAMAESCTAQGRQLLLTTSNDDPVIELRQVQALCEARVGALAIAPTVGLMPATVELLRGVPAIQVVRSHPALPLRAVAIDDRAGTRAATEHLIGLGHRRVGYLGISKEISLGAERLGGFHDALHSAGARIQACPTCFAPPQGVPLGPLVHDLVVKREATALLLGGATFHTEVLQALGELGATMPGKISLIACGDPGWLPLLATPVTAIALPVEETARTCAEHLFALADSSSSHGDPLRISLSPRLVLRQSTGRPAMP